MRSLRLILALALLPSVAWAQFASPLLANNGALLANQEPIWDFRGTVAGDVSCAANTPTSSIRCTFKGGTSATLQTAYNGSAGATPSILLTAGNGPVSIQAPAAAMGSLFRIMQTGAGADLFTVPDNGTVILDSTGALNLSPTTATSTSIGPAAAASAHVVTVTNQLKVNAQNAGAGGFTAMYVPVVHNVTANQAIEYGTQTLSAAGTATLTFATAFNATAVCTCTEQTNAANTIKCVPSATQLVFTLSSGAADVIAWACYGAR